MYHIYPVDAKGARPGDEMSRAILSRVAWTDTPLTLTTALDSWRWETSTVVIAVALGAAYLRGHRLARRNGAAISHGRAVCFLALGLGIWLLASLSMIGVYCSTLFWVRALQTLLVLYVAPFGLAAGKPLSVLRGALGATGQARFDAVLAGPVVRVLTYPLTGSTLMLVTPWLFFLSPWYSAVLRHGAADQASRVLLVAIGFCYFYARLQADPVPRHYTQSLSLLITVVESLADGLLGIILWLGPLVATSYYAEVARTWGPSMRTDQIIAAGVFWVLGDVLGLPFLLMLMRAFTADERRKAAVIDAELDAQDTARATTRATVQSLATAASDDEPPTSGLWWENDPQLRDRFRR
jgi:cytochrome c oxidase assembly factor CtaG